jgi:ubiquinone/menaquinone biosynthesis C-methylase UbiE
LRKTDKLLNIGCGNGLMELVLNYWVKEIISVDFSRGMIKRAQNNNRDNKNVYFKVANVLHLGELKDAYDKILCNSVIQYLNNLEEVAMAMEQMAMVSKTTARILISANPHKAKLDAYLSGYDKLDLPEAAKKKKREATIMSFWTEPAEIAGIAKTKGFKTSVLPMNPAVWQSWYMYDLLLWK